MIDLKSIIEAENIALLDQDNIDAMINSVQIIEEKQLPISDVEYKGGEGSGNFGHKGRPGEVGGSVSESSMPIPSQAKPYADEKAAVGPGWDKLNGILQGWAVAEDSGDSNVEILRSAATRAFGGRLSDSENAKYERIAERYRLDTSELEDSVRREYEFTQSKLKNDYPDGYVDLYRALHNVYDESDYPLEGKVSITEKSLSSWSYSSEGANKAIEYWGKNMGYRLLKTRIPTKDVFVYPGSSFAMRTQHEGEFVVIGRGNSIGVDIVDSVAYQSKEFEEKQLPISEASKLKLIQIRTNMFADEVNALAERMFTGNVTLGSWEEAMKKMVRELHTSTAAIGKGGWDQMTPADWGRLGPVLKSQYKYLHGFAQYVEENKDTVSLKAIQARARMYGNAGAFSSVIVQAGDVLAKKLPWLPKDGSTECLVNCKCYWKLDVVGTEVLKGGEGSGNFGHEGRPGEVGGSSTGGSSYAEKAKDYQVPSTSRMERDPFANIQRGFITEEGILLDAKKYSHEKFADEILHVDANAVSDKNREWLDKLGIKQIDNPEVTAIMDGLTRIHILRDETAITTKLMDTPTLHRLQKYFTSGLINRPLDSSVVWSGYLFNHPADVSPATVSTGIHMTWREFIAMDKVGYSARDNQIVLRESVEEHIEKQSSTGDASEGDWVMVQCVWHLRPAEHCKTCVSRNNHVVLIKVHKTVQIPSVIG